MGAVEAAAAAAQGAAAAAAAVGPEHADASLGGGACRQGRAAAGGQVGTGGQQLEPGRVGGLVWSCSLLLV